MSYTVKTLLNEVLNSDFKEEFIEKLIIEMDKYVDDPKKAVKLIINSIKKTPIKAADDIMVYSSLIQDYNLLNENEPHFYHYFDTAVYVPKEKTVYSAMTYPFNTICNATIIDKCFEVYNKVDLLVAIIQELTWFGLTEESSNKNQEEFLSSLDEVNFEPKNEKCAYLDELFLNVENSKHDTSLFMEACAEFNKNEFYKLGLDVTGGR